MKIIRPWRFFHLQSHSFPKTISLLLLISFSSSLKHVFLRTSGTLFMYSFVKTKAKYEFSYSVISWFPLMNSPVSDIKGLHSFLSVFFSLHYSCSTRHVSLDPQQQNHHRLNTSENWGQKGMCHCTKALLHLLHSITPPITVAQWGQHGSTVVSTAASQLQRSGFDSQLGSLSVWSLHVLPMSAWVSSGCSGFLPQSKDVRIRLIGQAKFPIVSQDL